jgi:hypothetical protein
MNPLSRSRIEALRRDADLSQNLLIDRVLDLMKEVSEELDKREATVSKEERWVLFLKQQLSHFLERDLDPRVSRYLNREFIDRCRERFPG